MFSRLSPAVTVGQRDLTGFLPLFGAIQSGIEGQGRGGVFHPVMPCARRPVDNGHTIQEVVL